LRSEKFEDRKDYGRPAYVKTNLKECGMKRKENTISGLLISES
jgi:predicted RNA-binding protein YlxR (DUF448 family)